MKVLLVDDEPGIREGLAMLLRRRGHEVATAGDCAAATMRLDGEPFDVVVTDWRLPDGLAATFLDGCRFPALVVSGHPEEVERARCVRDVLTKPVTPTGLLTAIAACGAVPDGPGADEQPAVSQLHGEPLLPEPLPNDVAEVVADFLRQLPPATAVEQVDDGTFLTLRALLPVGAVPTVRHIGGDLRARSAGGRSELQLRLCRDGRPDVGSTLVAFGAAWPEHGELAIDCAAASVPPAAFAGWLDRAAARRLSGHDVCFVNLPPALREGIEAWERDHEMPMRGRVGPRLLAELAELWS